MAPQQAPVRRLREIERLERVPLARRLAAGSTYAVLRQAVAHRPQRPACSMLPWRSHTLPDEALTAHDFLGKVHQTANLLTDLGMGPQDTLALLLPDLLETQMLLWGGQATGIVCLIPARLPEREVVTWLRATQAKVLVTPSLQVDQALWQKGEQVRRQVKSLAQVLQVRGPGNERESTYAFNALLDDYPTDRLHTGREIALDDVAVSFLRRDRVGTSGLLAITHGHLLYIACALSLVTALPAEEILLSGLARFFQRCW